MNVIRRCLQCGEPLPIDAPEGNCPICLVRLALGETDNAPDAPADSPSVVTSHASRTTLPTLRYFGNYELIEEIARGGMGAVFKARQMPLNRIVAVKMLLSGQFAGEDFVKRFRVEAEAAANLQHPNIVAIHEVGEHQGQHYFSMDYVEGTSLADLVRENPLPPSRAAAYLKTIAEAVHYAHQRGVLHRDLKPSNVLIDASDQPRVTDFGLAKRMVRTGSTASDSSSETITDAGERVPTDDLTLTGQLLGTPRYMSPEQAQGRRDLTVATDIYSLGAMLFHLLTGRPPFVADSFEGVLSQLQNNEPVSPRLLNAGLPRDLETICLKCLEKDPRKRYASVQELADELGRVLSDEPIHARPVAPIEKLWRWCRRKPALAGLSASVSLLLLTVAIGSSVAAFRINRARQEAGHAASEARHSERVATSNLRESYLAQAQALRGSSKLDRRIQALGAIAKAAQIEPSSELRNEAIATLGQSDFRIASIHAVAKHPDNEILDSSFTLAAVRLPSGQIEVQRAFSREPVARIRPPSGVTWLRRFSPDLRYLAFSTFNDGTCLWDLDQASFAARKLPGEPWGDFSPDSRTFAIGSPGQGILLIDLSTGREMRRIGGKAPSRAVGFDSSGEKLLCWDNERIEILNVDDGSIFRRLEVPGILPRGSSTDLSGAHRVAWSADGQLVAAGFGGRIYLFRVEDGKIIQEFAGDGSAIISVAMSPSGEFLAASSFHDTRVWEIQTGALLAGMPGGNWFLEFSRDNRYFGAGRLGTNNCIIEKVAQTCFRRLAPAVPVYEERQIGTLDFSVDDRLIAAAAGDGVRLWDSVGGQLLAKLSMNDASSALFDPDGTSLLVVAGGELFQWPLHYEQDNGTHMLSVGPSRNIGLPGGSWVLAALDRQSGRLAVSSENRRAALTSLRGPPQWSRLEKVHDGGKIIDISPGGKFLATGTWWATGVKIWDAVTGRFIQECGTNQLCALAFSPDGRWLAMAGWEYQVVPVGDWTNRQVLIPNAGGRPHGSTAFSPDGRLWARLKSSTSYELVEPGTWRTVAVLQSPHPFPIAAPGFSRDGTRFAVVDPMYGVQIWDLREVRRELADMGLDWDQPPYPPAATNSNSTTNELVVRVRTK